MLSGKQCWHYRRGAGVLAEDTQALRLALHEGTSHTGSALVVAGRVLREGYNSP